MKYDYKVVSVEKSENPLFPEGNVEDNLRSLGAEGWNLVSVVGGKAYFKKEIPGGNEPNGASIPPDENSAWHWQARSEYGEKRVEAITSQVAGVKSPSHKHRVICILDKDGNVVRGQTDMVNGHMHTIKVPGVTEDADGHTHHFAPNFHA